MMPLHPSVPNFISTAETNATRDRSAGFRRRLAEVRLGLEPRGGEVVLEHLPDHFGEGDRRTPAKLGARLARVTSEVGNFRRTEVRLVHLDMVLPVEPDQPEGELRQLTDGPLDAGGD